MTALVWDAAGERQYETGVDRGVLYLPLGGGVPWNGLTSITEILGREVKSYFVDGLKYLDYVVPGQFQGTLKAFTYPDELNDLIGVPEYAPGVFTHDQRSQSFSMSYRTRLGDDIDADEHYRLHLIWNVVATPSNVDMVSLADQSNLAPMEWTLNSSPPAAVGIRPTSHISLNTRGLDPALLTQLEDLLYGTAESDPGLPSPDVILTIVDEFYEP